MFNNQRRVLLTALACVVTLSAVWYLSASPCRDVASTLQGFLLGIDRPGQRTTEWPEVDIDTVMTNPTKVVYVFYRNTFISLGTLLTLIPTGHMGHVRYHCGGRPTEVNACVLNSYMVYL